MPSRCLTPQQPAELRDKRSFRGAALEIAGLTLLFFLLAGRPAPDVNEVHYLGKARHFWDPQWCRGDLFLESADIHTLFYAAWGWTANWLPFQASAWLGRILVWAALAGGWWRLATALELRPTWVMLTAGMFGGLLRWGHLSGEWVIGGVEAKGVAYAIVFFSLAWLVRGHWSCVWPGLGAAAAWHVLVGGWAVVAGAVAWIANRRSDALSLRTILVPLFIGAIFSLPGLLPPLLSTRQVDSTVQAQAQRIYVYDRLTHHLVPHAFPPYRAMRMAGLVALLAVLAVGTRNQPPARRLAAFAAASIGIALAGGALDAVLPSPSSTEASLLRFYWFRLADVAVPATVALLVPRAIGSMPSGRRQAATAIVAGLTTISVAWYWWADRQQVLPPADRQSDLAGADDPQQAWIDWMAACGWAQRNTAEDALFLTPDRIQTFKWYAGRPELANWKHVPQDPISLVTWQARRGEIHQALADVQHPAEALSELARRYRLDYALLWNEQVPASLRFHTTYANSSFTVVDLRSRAAASAEGDSPSRPGPRAGGDR